MWRISHSYREMRQIISSYIIRNTGFVFCISCAVFYYVVHLYMHMYAYNRGIASAHTYTSTRAYTPSISGHSTPYERDEHVLFYFVAQFSGIDILSGVPVTSNCMVVSASLSETFDKRIQWEETEEDVTGAFSSFKYYGQF